MKLGPSGTDEVIDDSGDNPVHGGWAFPALLATGLLVSAAVAVGVRLSGPQGASSPTTGDWSPSIQPQGDTVALEIDFGNGAKKFFSDLPWREGMTVADLMEEARRFRPGIEFSQQGTGASGLLTAIDGLKNEGSSRKHWGFRVDGRYGEQSFCLESLEPGMQVLWEFATGY